MSSPTPMTDKARESKMDEKRPLADCRCGKTPCLYFDRPNWEALCPEPDGGCGLVIVNPSREIVVTAWNAWAGRPTPAPSAGERERLAQWCDTQAAVHGNDKYYYAIASLLREGAAPEGTDRAALFDQVEATLKQRFDNPGRSDIISTALSVAFEQQLRAETALLEKVGWHYVTTGKGQYRLEPKAAAPEGERERLANEIESILHRCGEVKIKETLLQIISLLREDAWRPIETAPEKSRKPIDLWCDGKRWPSASWGVAETGSEGWCVTDLLGRKYLVAGGFAEPTHWQPLPAAPKAEGGA